MKCDVPSNRIDESYESIKEGMSTQNYWVRFFMRPCCPPPGPDAARFQIDHLKESLDAREDLTEEQREELKAIAEERLDWYLTLPVRHTA